MTGLWALLLLLADPPHPAAAPAGFVELRLTVGRSLVIDYPTEIARISTSDPEVVDAVPATTREFLVHGKGHGGATLVVWTKAGDRSIYNVTVEPNVEPLRRLLAENFPQEEIRVHTLKDEVTLTGRVTSKEVADRAAQLAAPVAKMVVNNLKVAAPPVSRQIVLRVRFAELNKSVGESFAVNLVSLGAGGTIGRVTTGQISPPTLSSDSGQTRVTISDALNIFAFRPDLDLMTFVRALQNQGVLQILAEPNLVTTSGKEASFVVGGEFPVPVVQGGANVGAVTIVFREFGVRLTFNPQITEHGTIKLHVRPEVSTLDFANAVTLSGFTVPALATRRVETHIELAQGQSFVIGGLIDDRVTENLSRIPGLASVPVLGALFKSRSESRSKTELVVLVTPEIAEPIQPGVSLPTPAFPKPFLPTVLEKSSDRERRPAGEARSRTTRTPPAGTAEGRRLAVTPVLNAAPNPAAASPVTAAAVRTDHGPARDDRPASLREGRESGLSAIPDVRSHAAGRAGSGRMARR